MGILMNLNIVLDRTVVLDLLSTTPNDIQHCFNRLQKSPIRFWIPCAILTVLETQLVDGRYKALQFLLDEGVQLLSSLAAHWQQIPAQHPNKIQALISLDAAILPENTIIWTQDEDFASAHPQIEAGDHEFIYSMMAEYESGGASHLVDLAKAQLQIRANLEQRMFRVLKHGQYLQGEEVHLLENQLAAYVGVKHCVSVANGTDALLCALLALGVKAGDEVITPAFSCIAAVEMMSLIGVIPVFVDIDPETYNLDPKAVAAAITPRAKAILAVNLYGQCADYHQLHAVAGNLPIIEDASQSFGASYHGKISCSLGNISCTSFLPSKPLGCYGDGGACFTNDDALANTLRQLRAHEQRYQYPVIGMNSRLDSLQAAILLEKLAVFPKEVVARQQVAKVYAELFAAKIVGNSLRWPHIAPENTSIYAQYTIALENREAVQQRLHQAHIATAVHYPLPLHLQPAFAYLSYAVGSFPHAERAAQQVLSLPMHPYLREETQLQIVTTLKNAVSV
jgi:UDP-2-acetamido-2-deoxy-ribo-hexuluronate aminotransferase